MKEAIEGLHKNLHALANVSWAIMRLLKNTNQNVGFIVDQIDPGSDAESRAREMEGASGVRETVRARETDKDSELGVEETLQ